VDIHCVLFYHVAFWFVSARIVVQHTRKGNDLVRSRTNVYRYNGFSVDEAVIIFYKGLRQYIVQEAHHASFLPTIYSFIQGVGVTNDYVKCEYVG
jgi:hypothetical protein